MDKVRRDQRKDVHTILDFGEGPRERTREDSHHSSAKARTTKPEWVKVQDHLRYGDRHVLDRLGHRRESAFDRLSETYSPSTTKSRPWETDFMDPPRGRSRPYGLDTSKQDRPKDRERIRSVEESYDDSFSHSYRDGNHSRHMKRRKDNESPLFNVSRSDSIDGRYWRSRSKRHKSTDEDDLTRPWMCEEEDPFTPQIQIGRIKGAPECMQISGFMHGVHNSKLTKRLNEHIPKTVEEMMITTTAFIRGEAAASKKKGHAS
uniref:Reverse transcriptase domain-containing protein n=1 Tax=Tanacetum cinerariifolium TaxID=118510 RepID=A0A6L2JAD1_TANCI|nr:reverse transcriptase domain-containing protein [Tanacetum cinerariifolium]